MKHPMTRNGYEKLSAELRKLKTQDRPNIVEAIAVARDHGDLSENAEYHSAREQQSLIEGRIMDIENIQADANIIDVRSLKGNTITFGSTVTIVDEETDEEKTYTLVGDIEADIRQHLISIFSPIGRALLGKTAGDSMEFVTPNGVTKEYEILSVEYKEW